MAMKSKRERFAINQARDRGSLEFGSKKVKHEGSVMSIATRGVVTVPPTTTIKGAAEAMTKHGFRRLPVADAGTKRLLGIIGSSDIIDFLGGGEKARLIIEKHRGNFLAAINDSVREIMVPEVLTVGEGASLDDALGLILDSRVGGVVIVDDSRRATAIVTERDFVNLIAGKATGKKVDDYMTKRVIVANPNTTLGEATRTMVRNSFRRLPVVADDELVGMLTTRHIIEFIGKNHVFSKGARWEAVLNTRIGRIMKKRVSTLAPGSDLGDAAGLIKETGMGTVCIVEGGELTGILTERDITESLRA